MLFVNEGAVKNGLGVRYVELITESATELSIS
jgi:hypothetical protein